MAGCCNKKQSKKVKEWGKSTATNNTKNKISSFFKKVGKTNQK